MSERPEDQKGPSEQYPEATSDSEDRFAKPPKPEPIEPWPPAASAEEFGPPPGDPIEPLP